MKKSFTRLLAFSVMLSVGILASAAFAADPIVIRLACTSNPDSNYAEGMFEFERLAEKYSDGKLDIQTFPGGVLGNERDLIEGVGLGTLEMCVTSTGPLASFSEAFMVLDLPYVFTTQAEVIKFTDSPYGQEILDSLQPKGIKALGFWENGFRHMSTHNPVVHPSDVKGLKIRTMENPIHIKTYEVIGAGPTPMATGEVYSALQQGVIDGIDNAFVGLIDQKSYEINKCIALTAHFYSPAVCMINVEFFNKLAPELQEVILKAQKEARLHELAFSAALDVKNKERLANEGVKFTEIDKNEWKEATKSVADFFKDRLNPKHIAAIYGE